MAGTLSPSVVVPAWPPELVTVIARPKFDKYVTEEEKTKFIDDLLDEAIDVEVIETITDCRDSKDNKYLELAVSGSATHIITGGADLLVMNPFRGIAIVAPPGASYRVADPRI